jgi:hypothetical protein
MDSGIRMAALPLRPILRPADGWFKGPIVRLPADSRGPAVVARDRRRRAALVNGGFDIRQRRA